MKPLWNDLNACGLITLADNRSINQIRKGWKELRDSKGKEKEKGGSKGKKNKTTIEE